MLKEKDAVVRRFVIILDAFVVACVFFLALELRQQFHNFYRFDLIPSARVVANFGGSRSDYLVVLLVIAPLWCAVLYLNGMYRTMRTRTIWQIMWIIAKSAFFVAVIFGAFVFLFKLKFVSRMFFVIFLVACSFALALEKAVILYIVHRIRKRGYNYRRLLVVGTGRRAADFIGMIRNHPEWGFKIVGVVNDESARQASHVANKEVIGGLDDMPALLRRFSVDEVIFVVPRSRLSHIEKSLYACETLGVKATVAVDLFELKIAKARQTEIEGIPLITFETTPAGEWQLFIKRSADVIFSGLGVIVLSPLFLATAVIIKLTSRGPVFFLQKRSGLNGRRFILYKFRTMYGGAHARLAEMAALNEMKGPVFKIKNDPRITPIGRYLRKFSIDELPQLFNVFMGHMSLVGPRPPIPKEVSQYEPWQRRRLSMRPGITCLWQISGRNKISFEEWMKLDLEYLDNWSLWLDIKILMKTIPVVLFGIGAY